MSNIVAIKSKLRLQVIHLVSFFKIQLSYGSPNKYVKSFKNNLYYHNLVDYSAFKFLVKLSDWSLVIKYLCLSISKPLLTRVKSFCEFLKNILASQLKVKTFMWHISLISWVNIIF